MEYPSLYKAVRNSQGRITGHALEFPDGIHCHSSGFFNAIESMPLISLQSLDHQ